MLCSCLSLLEILSSLFRCSWMDPVCQEHHFCWSCGTRLAGDVEMDMCFVNGDGK